MRRLVVCACLAALLGSVSAACGGEGGPPDPELLMVSSRDGDYAIFVMDAEGKREARLSEERGDPRMERGLAFQIDPAWSPDGRRIAFASRREGTLDLFVVNADGTGTRRLTSTRRQDSHPTWSPDGRQIAFQRGTGQLFVVGADGKGARRVTDDLAEETQPAWSPDGRWIAYVRRTPGTSIREVWLVRPDGSGRRKLTSRRSVAYDPAWSPDGRRIAFAGEGDESIFEIYSVGVDGAGLRRVTRSAEDAFEPSWSPDGRTIAFARGGSIFTVDLQGVERELTSAKSNDSSPAWNPRPPSDGD